MGVNECCRLYCDRIMCGYICSVNGLYVCWECFEEFIKEMRRVGFESDVHYKKKVVDKKTMKFLESGKGGFKLNKGPKTKELMYVTFDYSF